MSGYPTLQPEATVFVFGRSPRLIALIAAHLHTICEDPSSGRAGRDVLEAAGDVRQTIVDYNLLDRGFRYLVFYTTEAQGGGGSSDVPCIDVLLVRAVDDVQFTDTRRSWFRRVADTIRGWFQKITAGGVPVSRDRNLRCMYAVGAGPA